MHTIGNEVPYKARLDDMDAEKRGIEMSCYTERQGLVPQLAISLLKSR